MKYSIRTKLTSLIFVALILLAFILGGTSILSTQKLTDEYAHQNVTLMCEKKAAEINGIFEPLEQSVAYMSRNALDELSNPMNLTDKIYYENYIDKMKSVLWDISNSTDGAVDVYLRLNPQIYGSTSGVFMTRESLNAEMKSVAVTDLNEYSEDDLEHVGWYYQPIKAKKEIWMTPYYNKNIGVYMISYVTPLFKDDITIGVLGMDINFNYVIERINNINVYDSGYAYITDEKGNVIYHPYLEYGDAIDVIKDWWNCSCDLNNGMILNITAPEKEINASRNELIRNLIIITIVIVSLFILTTVYVTNKMIAPLQRLNQIANEISGGNYDIDFNFARPRDEIGQLTKSFENTVETLKEYTTYINGLAYNDSLTGVRNRMAYDHQINLIEEKIEKGEQQAFGIAVFDVNNLKKINDNLGHEKGDELIKGACKLICQIFSHSAVFRIGGDEFTAIIKENEPGEADKLFKQFEKEMEKTWNEKEPARRISIAYGYSCYNPTTDDKKVEATFKRADELMYANKRLMKEKNKTEGFD